MQAIAIGSPSLSLPTLHRALSSFTASSLPFKIIHSFSSSFPPSSSSSSAGAGVMGAGITSGLKRLFVLDSSFNPPTRAHLEMAVSCLCDDGGGGGRGGGGGGGEGGEEKRLVLLLATANADKAPKPASTPQRLFLMTHLSTSILTALTTCTTPTPAPTPPTPTTKITIDIALTTQPLFLSKSHSLTKTYPLAAEKIFLMGFDTLVRILDAKYYRHHRPDLSAQGEEGDVERPLLVLKQLFEEGVGIRCTVRAEDDAKEEAEEDEKEEKDNSIPEKNSKATITTTTKEKKNKKKDDEEEQKKYLQRLKNGEFENVGFKREWAEKIELVDSKLTTSISSSKAREAAARGDEGVLDKLLTPEVKRWVLENGVYSADYDVSTSS